MFIEKIAESADSVLKIWGPLSSLVLLLQGSRIRRVSPDILQR